MFFSAAVGNPALKPNPILSAFRSHFALVASSELFIGLKLKTFTGDIPQYSRVDFAIALWPGLLCSQRKTHNGVSMVVIIWADFPFKSLVQFSLPCISWNANPGVNTRSRKAFSSAGIVPRQVG